MNLGERIIPFGQLDLVCESYEGLNLSFHKKNPILIPIGYSSPNLIIWSKFVE